MAEDSKPSHTTEGNTDNSPPSSPQRQQQLPSKAHPLVVTSASDNDVLLGRGNQINNRSGNLQYRSYVKERATEYWFCPDKIKKDAIAREVMRKILDAGGRFLKPRAAETSSGEWTQIFEVVDEMSVLGKTKQALRDTAAAKRLDGTSAQVQARSAAAAAAGNETSLRSPLLRSLQPPPHAAAYGVTADTAPLLSLAAGGLGPQQQQPQSSSGLDILEHLRALQSMGGGGGGGTSGSSRRGLPNTALAAASLGADERERFRIAHLQRALLQEQLLRNVSLHPSAPAQWQQQAQLQQQQQLQWLQQQQQLQLLHQQQQQRPLPGASTLDQLLLLQQQQQDPQLLALLQQQQQQRSEAASAATMLHPRVPESTGSHECTTTAVAADNTHNPSRAAAANNNDDAATSSEDDDNDEEEEEELVGLARQARSV